MTAADRPTIREQRDAVERAAQERPAGRLQHDALRAAAETLARVERVGQCLDHEMQRCSCFTKLTAAHADQQGADKAHAQSCSVSAADPPTDALVRDIGDLIVQATTERSHFYTRDVLERARDRITTLAREKADLARDIENHRIAYEDFVRRIDEYERQIVECEAERDAALARAEAADAALRFYADPNTYFAISFLDDPPCGAFMDDFETLTGELGHPSGADWVKPGKRARAALAQPRAAEGE